MLATGGLPAAIVVGRTLTTPSTASTDTPAPSYFVGEVENNQVTETITVYDELADTETGVLVTYTLEAGVTLVSSIGVAWHGTTTTQLPDQSGQKVAWSLAPIQGYDRESVAFTLNLPSAGRRQHDEPVCHRQRCREKPDAMLDAGAVSASTPAATLQPGNVSNPSLLASTVDADTNVPFIQEEAAALDYDRTQNIYNFLHTQNITYSNAYNVGSRARGPRYTFAGRMLGNALDVASLGVAS